MTDAEIAKRYDIDVQKLYTPKEAAGILGVHRSTIRRLCRDNVIPADDKGTRSQRFYLIWGMDLVIYIQIRRADSAERAECAE